MTTARYALFGWPVKHSVSPQMQEAGFRAIGSDATYELVSCPPEALAAKVGELKAAGYRGWNVTVPHKTAMLALVDEVEPTARAAGSVNTVANADGRLRAWSTDGYGLARSLDESFGLAVPGARVVFWGAGGAARATSVYFAAQGAAAITVVNRTVSRAADLAADLRRVAPACIVTVADPNDERTVRTALGEADVLVQSTSVGLRADDPIAVPPALLHPALRVVDMIYRDTPLLQAARACGCATADGRGMLLWQGVRSFELWTGCEAPVPVMRAALTAALAARETG